jgi:peptidyl-tRNA hydrolase
MWKLYLALRSDLTPGAKVAQACHGLRAFVAAHPELDANWHTNSNNLVVVEFSDENALRNLVTKAETKGVPFATFQEPDFDDSLTCVALGPGGDKLVSSAPLALREGKKAA